MEEKTVVIVGATGSIGTQTLDVLRKVRGFKLVGFTYHRNRERAERIAAEFEVEDYMSTESEARRFEEFIENLKPDVVVLAVPGFSGLKLALSSIPHTKRLALANKESLVCGGWLLKERLEEHGVELIPVDSEHSAIFQLMEPSVVGIILTASGGALRDWPVEKLKDAKIEDVMKHPNWNMGVKVTVDSATMVNKAFEVLEAMELFDLEREKIRVLMHRQSLVHGIVLLRDGSMKMHASFPDMRIPIALALTYPDRNYEAESFLDLTGGILSFEPIDEVRYPSFFLVDGVKDSYKLRTAFNAADEVAVEAFAKGEIEFTDIHEIILDVLDGVEKLPEPKSLEDLIEIDRISRKIGREVIR